MSHTIDNKVEEKTEGVPQGRLGIARIPRGSDSNNSNKENHNSLYGKFKRGAAGLLVGIGLMGLAGCATTGSYAVENNIGYEAFFDSRGDYKLVGRNNDVYLEKIDGSDSRQITHTPGIKEAGADFGREGKYILYIEDILDNSAKIRGKYYKINFDSDDSNRKQISGDEYASLMQKHNEEADTEEEE